MKRIYYIGILLLTVFFTACEKHVIEFDARPATDVAEFQIHWYSPITPSVDNTYMYKIDINNTMVANSTTPLKSYNSQPNSAGRYFTAEAGSVNIKLYQSTDLNLVYDQNVTLAKGKQNVVIHDLNLPPIVFETEYPFIIDRQTYDTDTIAFVKFYNILYEYVNAPTTLKLQYQYRKNWVHPLYTLEDLKNGRIPEGKNVGDATDTRAGVDVGSWTNLGAPVSFGETTGWQVVPVEKNTYVSQGVARLDYRIIVTEGGIEGINMNSEGLLLAQTTSGSAPIVYSDYWNSTIGRRVHHFYTGIRTEKPGAGVRILLAK